MIKPILLLGDPALYEISRPASKEEIDFVKAVSEDLHDTLMNYRVKFGAGRAIAAPQIGVRKRIVYMCIDTPVIFINPVLEYDYSEQIELLDDCMSFPGLLVKVKRYKRCTIRYKNIEWDDCETELDGALSELLQHECDHLDGILATMRAADSKAFHMQY